MRIRCPHCEHGIEVVDLHQVEELTCPSCDSRIALSGPSLGPTKRLTPRQIGQFTLTDELGSGAFGTVWKAYDETLDRSVAVKIPRVETGDPAIRRQMVREARAAAQLQHPNIVGIHEVGLHESSVYIVSDLIDGISLADSLRLKRPEFREIAELCATIADALHHAHERGVVHRDLKPANVLVDGSGVPYITDFGLAKRDTGEITVTVDGQVLGTPAYMSPQQASGKGHHVDRRSDIYSLGAMMYEMLCERRPFQGSSRLLIHQVIHEDPKSPRRFNKLIPKDLETICLKAMQKDPQRRYDTAEKMAKDLRRFLDGKIIAARPVGPAEKSWRWVRRNRVVSALGVLAIVSSCAAIIAAATRPPLPGMDVDVLTEPVGAAVAVVPLDPATRLPREEEILRPAGNTPLTVRLLPGDYIVEVALPNGDHQMVFRHVPEDPHAQPSILNHVRWESISEDSISWPEVVIPNHAAVAAGDMILITGGRFNMGDGERGRTIHERNVPTFYLDRTEFIDESTGEPAVNVSWDKAVADAEAAGKRLMWEAEYEYAATDGTDRKFPWGSSPPEPPEWNFDVGLTAPRDVTPMTGVEGLLSGVAEWTGDGWWRYGPADISNNERAMELRREARAFRGGTTSIVAGEQPNAEIWAFGVRHRVFHRATDGGIGLGFRAARWAQPRYVRLR